MVLMVSFGKSKYFVQEAVRECSFGVFWIAIYHKCEEGKGSKFMEIFCSQENNSVLEKSAVLLIFYLRDSMFLL